MKPFTVIGKYIPTRWNLRIVARALEKISFDAGLVPLPIGNYRLHKGPYQNYKKHSDLMRRRPKYDTSDAGWHQDGDSGGNDMKCSLVLWSTNTPTQFQYIDKIYEPNPYEVVVANNLSCTHRRNPNSPRIRWLFRQRVVTPAWLS